MAILVRKIAPRNPVHKSIHSIDKGSCCTPDCRRDSIGIFRTSAGVGPYPVITQVTEIQIDGETKTLGAPISVTTNAGLKALISAIKLFLYEKRYSGDGIEINVYDDGRHDIKIVESEAEFNSLSTDASPVNFKQITDGLFDDCDCIQTGPPLPPEGIGDKCIFCGDVPPFDTTILWRNNNDLMTYFYDGAHWVTQWGDDFQYNDTGNTTNNTFLRFGFDRLSDENGPVSLWPIKIYRATVRKDNSNSGDFKIWSNSNDEGNFTIGAATNQVIPVSYIIPQNQNVSPQWVGGPPITEVKLILFYRKIYIAP